MTDEELKGWLLAKAEVAIAGVLAKHGSTDAISLREIETLALTAGQEMSAAVVETLMRENMGGAQWVACPKCGRTMHNKGKRRRYSTTDSGNTFVERFYYYCPTCRTGLFRTDKIVRAEGKGA